MQHTAIIRDAATGKWLRFSRPRQILVAERTVDVLPALRRVEAAVDEEGLWAAGFLAYEAAPAFDRALRVRPAGPAPLLWFGLFDPPEEVSPPSTPQLREQLSWSPALDRPAYDRAIARIRQLIADGDTYQVNFTFPLRAPFRGEAEALFWHLALSAQAPYAAFLDTGPFAVCSASPELFFRLEGREMTCRPMKGTAPRGRTPTEDEQVRERLLASAKDRAENLMIVDMLRNDLGRVAATGSVVVPELFRAERYPTVWQLTSTVTARSDASLCEIMAALFPCASITGAPKARTMEIIAELERFPRQAYTGTLGYFAPGRRAQFNVAIRTVLVDRAAKQAEFGVGGGVTWSSDSAGEYAECLVKARLLGGKPVDFELLETLLWDPAKGFFLLNEHMKRLADSALYFGFPFDPGEASARLRKTAEALPPVPHKVRLRTERRGGLTIEHAPLEPAEKHPLRLALAAEPVDPNEPLLYHKTTRRQLYEAARTARPEEDEVLLWNTRGEVTEGCNFNLVVRYR
ncbi:MAG: aminodeoxychorismate synthase, component I [Desulfuromonas sp.]|nr:MAG: aminodeoxychorismate synthase, component I [Desulfuromonas sp.]